MKKQKETMYYHPHVKIPIVDDKDKNIKITYYYTRMSFAGMQLDKNTLSIGYCKLSKEDNFCKKKGRSLSRIRAHQKRNMLYNFTETENKKNSKFVQICQDIINELGYSMLDDFESTSIVNSNDLSKKKISVVY